MLSDGGWTDIHCAVLYIWWSGGILGGGSCLTLGDGDFVCAGVFPVDAAA